MNKVIARIPFQTYERTIMDMDQPLLVSRLKKIVSGNDFLSFTHTWFHTYDCAGYVFTVIGT